MKTKLLLALLFISSYTFAQTWEQVGATQFATNFALNGELAFNNSGVPYVVYENVTGNGIYVMKFNGTNWEIVGSGAISAEDYNDITIKINPVTNEPWVVLKSSAGGTSSNLDILRFDGSFWVAEGLNIGGGLYTYGIQIQFSSTGLPRIAGMISGGGTDRAISFYTYNGTTWTQSTGHEGNNARIDFYEYDSYLLASSSGNLSNFNFDNTLGGFSYLTYRTANAFRRVSGIVGTNFFAVNNANSNTILVQDGVTAITQPSAVANTTNDILKFRESTADNNYYLMYSDSSEELEFQKYKTNDKWSTLPSIGISTDTADFFAKMEMNPIDGNMYILYKDGTRLSLKKFNIQPTLAKYYVDTNVSGGNGSGDSWANAMPSLTTALVASDVITTEIWIAEGTYTPDVSDRDVSFTVEQDNLTIYGGFSGSETTVFERDIVSNPTILSGDLLGDDDANITYNNTTRDDNSLRIVQINANNITIDGVTIANGYANQSTGEGRFGAGLDTDDSVTTFTIKNSIIKNNVAWWAAGLGLYSNMSPSTMTIDACIFENNLSSLSASFYALPRANKTMNFNLSNSLFKNNRTENNTTSRPGVGSPAGFIRAHYSGSSITANVTNNTFVNNVSLGTGTSDFPVLGVGKTSGSVTITASNNIFWRNTTNSSVTSLAIGAVSGDLPNSSSVLINNSIDEDNFSNLLYLTNTSSVDPLFTDASNNDFTLQVTSPAINSGDNNQIPLGVTGDILGNLRIFNTTVDMGAYEFGSTSSLGIDDSKTETESFKLYPNPTTNLLNIEMTDGFEYAEIYSMSGKKVLKFTTERIDVSNIAKGVYLLKVKSTTGLFFIKRFIKK